MSQIPSFISSVSEPSDLSADQLMALSVARLCHDLVNPLGAISNGVELLSMSPGTDGPEMQLIAESVANANARVRFFRVAFGPAAADQMLDARSVHQILEGLAPAQKQDVVWDIEGGVPQDQVKLMFLLLLCMETAIPWGGQVQVTRNGAVWQVTARAERFADIADHWRVITHAAPCGDITAKQVQFPLAASTQDALAQRIDLVMGDKSLTLTIRPA